ncbi:MAG TPA: dCTP deaminase [Terracidiphilus sp.]|nr:dCTP deaminase [Terracidiphilus sp.]
MKQPRPDKRQHIVDRDFDAGVVITPMPLNEDWSDDAVNLRLGNHFLLPQSPPQPFIVLDDVKLDQTRVHVPWGEYLVLPPHHTVLGSTLEFIKLPLDLAGQILTRSSIARTFIIIETAPWIHPGYRGCLTLEIANVSNTPVLLHPGIAIGQLLLLTVDLNDEEKQERETLKGSYIGPTFPEAPTFKSLREQLQKVGVDHPKVPTLPWSSDDATAERAKATTLAPVK